MHPLTHTLAACVVGGLLSMGAAALLTFGLPHRWLTRMISFSTGVLLATAFLDLLPEAAEAGLETHTLFALLLAGLLGFFFLEKAALWRHSHDAPAHSHDLVRTVPIILLGDTVHNFTDGLVLAAAFLVDPHLGWATALAIAAHEIPQEAGDFILLLAAGWRRSRALLWNGLSSLAAVLGGGGREGAAHLAVERAPRPQPARLVEEAGHLRGQAAEAGRAADDDRVVVAELAGRGHRGGLVELEVGLLGDLVGDQLRDPLDDGFDALDRAIATSVAGCDRFQDAFLWRAKARIQLHQPDAAREDLQRCVTLGANTPEGQECASLGRSVAP